MVNSKIMKKLIVIVVFMTTMILSWILPDLYKTATDEAPEYPLSFYSSVADKFCSFVFTDDDFYRTDVDGNRFTQQQFDSLLPMIYTNQLVYDGKMPKKVRGVDVDLQKIRISNFSYRYKPKAYQKPSIKLYPLFESMSARVDLSTPDDVFRISDKIEFIDIESNTVNSEKSVQYNKALYNSGFSGPAKRIAGIPSARKNYDEGYFIIDSNNALFHMKCVNGKPFIRNVNIDKSINIECFEATDYPNRESYGFLFDSSGQMYVLTTEGYNLQKLGIPPIDMKNTVVTVMANMFFWNVMVKVNNSKTTYAIDARTKKYVDSIESINANIVYHWIENIFPFIIKLTSNNDEYIKPRFMTNYPVAFLFNIFFVLTYLCIFRRNRLSNKILPSLWICITGIYGFIACLLFKSDIN